MKVAAASGFLDRDEADQNMDGLKYMPLSAALPSTLGARSILMLLPVVVCSDPSWLVHHQAMAMRLLPNRLSSRPAPASSVATVADGLALEFRCSLSRSQKEA